MPKVTCSKRPRRVTAREALRRLVNYLEQDPDLYVGDDDNVLRKLIRYAKTALAART